MPLGDEAHGEVDGSAGNGASSPLAITGSSSRYAVFQVSDESMMWIRFVVSLMRRVF